MANNITVHVQGPNDDTIREIEMVGLAGSSTLLAELVRYGIATNIETLTSQENWNAGQNFVVGDGVTESTKKYICIQDNLSTIGNGPGNALFWKQVDFVSGTTYSIGDQVVSVGIYYISLIDNNLGNTPASSATEWKILGVQTLRFNDDKNAALDTSVVAPAAKKMICDIKYIMESPGNFEIIDTTVADQTSGATFSQLIFAPSGPKAKYLQSQYTLTKAKHLTIVNKSPKIVIKEVTATLYETTG